jgi:hypothetical protein
MTKASTTELPRRRLADDGAPPTTAQPAPAASADGYRPGVRS